MLDWLEDWFPMLLIVVCVGLIGLMIVAVIEDGREMEAKRVAFYQRCTLDRKPYECDLMWDTYAAAHSAEINSSIAAANAGMAAARR